MRGSKIRWVCQGVAKDIKHTSFKSDCFLTKAEIWNSDAAGFWWIGRVPIRIQAGTWLVTVWKALVGPGNSHRVPYWILVEYNSLPGWSTFTQLWLVLATRIAFPIGSWLNISAYLVSRRLPSSGWSRTCFPFPIGSWPNISAYLVGRRLPSSGWSGQLASRSLLDPGRVDQLTWLVDVYPALAGPAIRSKYCQMDPGPLFDQLSLSARKICLSIYPRWVGLSQKTISRDCPFKRIVRVRPFELGGETWLIRSAVINWRHGRFFFILMHERNILYIHLEWLQDFWHGFIQSEWLTSVFQSLERQFKHSYQFRLD